MNTTKDRYRIPSMRASDAERDEVIAALSEHYQAGRLTSEELDDRTGQALRARTLDELDELTTDLPGPVPSTAQPVPAAYGPGRARLPVVALLAVVAVVAIAGIAVAALSGRHGWNALWLVVVVPVIARRIAVGRALPSRSSHSLDDRRDRDRRILG
jgi:uncharacterized protein DUF1707